MAAGNPPTPSRSPQPIKHHGDLAPRSRPGAGVRRGPAPVPPLLHGPLLPALFRLALPTVAVLFMTTLLSVAETYFVSSLGRNAIAGNVAAAAISLLGFLRTRWD